MGASRIQAVAISFAVLAWHTEVRAVNVPVEDRVAAQRAIERAYYAHQLHTNRPFEEAVPAGVIRAKALRGLELTAALARYWHTEVTTEMLDAEVERMVRHTRMPERLQELFDALKGDPTLIRECLARPALAERLTRSAFAAAPPQGTNGAAWDAWWSSIEPTLTAAATKVVVHSGSPTPAVRATESCVAPNSWDPASLDNGPNARDGATAVWTGSRLIVWGGERGGLALATGFQYDPSTDSWEGMTTTGAPDPRIDHVAVWTGSKMIIWAGDTPGSGTPNALDTGGQYDPIADAWTSTTTTGAPSGRIGPSAVWTGTVMVVWGGGAAGGGVVSGGGRYDPVADHWTPTSTVGEPSGRRNQTAVWSGTEMIVWGGQSASSLYLLTGARYDPVADTWTATDVSRAPIGRSLHTAVWTSSRMIIWGGYSGAPRGDGASYDPIHDRWTALSTSGAPAARYDHTAIWSGTRMIVWGGRGAGDAFLASGASYDPAAGTWSALSTTGAPEARYSHVASWVGNRMVVWGGYGSSGDLATGGRYDPGTNSWSPTAVSPGPAPRSGATSAWTGTRLLIWGGWDGAPRGDGSAYDPALDAWFPITLGSAPLPRRYHTAVWTGERFIVWGGDIGTSTPTATGAAYDPIADAWAPTSLDGAPDARLLHTAVWTGHEMIVWGGDITSNDNGTPFQSGGRYSPASDSWSPTDLVTAPSARSSHVSVWTGREMIIYGGKYSFNLPDQGARYDPAKDRWRLMSNDREPTGISSSLPPVWTGKLFVVWDGYGASPVGQHGGRYDPELDVWSHVSFSATGTSRTSYSSAWTGKEMVIWGGDEYYPSQTLRDGTRYDPAADTWTPMTLTNAPEQRDGHVMAMCGDFLTIWGGRLTQNDTPNNSYDNDGSRFVLDRNGNGIADSCDSDDDSDGVPDTLDCAPGDPTVAHAAAPITDLTVERHLLSWTAQDPGTTYDAARGDLAELRSGSTITSTCLGAYLTTPSVADDLIDPEPDAGYWYLVRAVNICGDSGWGDTGGPDWRVAACPPPP